MTALSPQLQESYLFGQLAADISSSATTITARFVDLRSGDARTPNANTKLFVIDKGNGRAEIVLAGSHSTASGVTTLSSVTRGISVADPNLTAGTGVSHTENAEIGCVDVHTATAIMTQWQNGTNGSGANNLRVGDETAADISIIAQNNHSSKPKIYWDDSNQSQLKASMGDDGGAGGDFSLGSPIFTTAERDALTSPLNGMTIYNSTLGQMQWREGGAWVTNAAGGTTADGSTTVAGKFEEATVAEQGTAAATGGTGARLLLANANVVKTSSGAGDENKILVLNASGQIAAGFINDIWIGDALFTAKGDLLSATAASTPSVLAVGTTNGMTLQVDSTAATGLAYALDDPGKYWNLVNNPLYSGDAAGAWTMVNVGTGTQALGAGRVILTTGTSSDDLESAYIRLQATSLSDNDAFLKLNDLVTGKKYIFEMAIAAADITPANMEIRFGFAEASSEAGADTASTAQAKFRIIDTQAASVVSDGTGAVTATNIAVSNLSFTHLYRIEFIPGTSAKFYVDGTLLDTRTTNIPLNSDNVDLYLFIGVKTKTTAAKVIFVSSIPYIALQK